ncbi:hypothetical protein [Rubrobacter calidifluminis]|uniref:aggregation-promoting factor C-terminal-like domain-containing protein n=1 Tax=Rubrobacter calidifluminis TaxID=1392640 RepID=UPI00235EA5B3|nr:hypothetical protein [Rubrobacter calidifluminis]
MPTYKLSAELSAKNNASRAIASLSAELKGLSRQLDALDRKRVSVSVSAETASATASLKEVERQAQRVSSIRPSVRVEANTAPLERSLAAANARLDRFGARSVTAEAKVDVDRGGLSRLARAMALLTSLSGPRFRALSRYGARGGIFTRIFAFPVRLIGNISRLSGAAFSLAGRIGPLAALFSRLGVSAADFGSVLGGLVGGGGVILATAAALGGLTNVIGGAGAGLVGALGVLGGALTSVTAGFGLLALAALPFIKNVQEVIKAQKKYSQAVETYGKNSKQAKSAQQELNQTIKSQPPAVRRTITAFSSLERAYDRYIGSNKVLQRNIGAVAVEAIRLAKGAMPALGRASARASVTARRAFSAIAADFRRPATSGALMKVLNAAPRQFGVLLRAAGHFGSGLTKAFAIAMPYVGRMFRSIDRLARSFDRYASSARGQRTLNRIFKTGWQIMRLLGRASVTFFDGMITFGVKHRRAIVGALRAIGAAFRAIWFVLRVSSAAFGLFVRGLNAVLRISNRAGRAVHNWLISSFRQALKAAANFGVGVAKRWHQFSSTTARTFKDARNSVVKNFNQATTRALIAAGNLRGGAERRWRDLKAHTAKDFGAIYNSVSSRMSRSHITAVKQAGALMKEVAKRWSSTRGDTKDKFSAIASLIASRMSRSRNSAVRSAGQLYKDVAKRWSSTRGDTRDKFTAIASLIGDRMSDALHRASNRAHDLYRDLTKTWGRLWHATGELFRKISGSMWKPIRSAYDFIARWVNRIVGLINSVLDKVGLPTIKWRMPQYAEGGMREYGSSRRGSEPARPGVAFAEGGKVEKPLYVRHATYLVGEDLAPGEREYILTESRKGNRRKRNARLWAEYGKRNGLLRPFGERPGTYVTAPVPAYAAGGLFSDEQLKSLWRWARSKNGSPYVWGGGSIPPGVDCSGWAALVMKRALGDPNPSGRLGSTANMPWRGWERGPGQLSFGFINGGPGGGHVAMTIAGKGWAANTETGGPHGNTWTNTMSNQGPAWGASNPYFHGNIWHLGSDVSLADIGGGGGFNPLAALFERLWSKLVAPFVNRTLSPLLHSRYVMERAIGAAAKRIPDEIKRWIESKIGSGGGDYGSDAIGGDPAKNRALGRRMVSAAGWASQWGAFDRLAMRESGWNRFARNPSSGAYGIPQALPESKLPPAGRSTGGSHAGPQIGWMIDYIRQRYGNPNSAWAHEQSAGWYARGGYIRRDHIAEVHRNELFMPLDSPHVERTAQTALGTKELKEEIVRLREAVERSAKDSQRLDDDTIRRLAVAVGHLVNSDLFDEKTGYVIVQTLKEARRHTKGRIG